MSSLTGIPALRVTEIASDMAVTHPDLPPRTIAVDVLSGYDWNPDWLHLCTPGVARTVDVARWLAFGDRIIYANHDDIVRCLARAVESVTGYHTRMEHSVRVDGGTKRADLTVSHDIDDDVPFLVVEVKHQIAGHWQAQQAVDQVRRYGCGFARLGGAPTLAVVAHQVTRSTPSALYGIPIMSPDELLDRMAPDRRKAVA